MHGPRKFVFGLAIPAVLSAVVAVQLSEPSRPPTALASDPIQHIIIMDKENRSFDSMFGRFPNADGATTYTNPQGKTLPLTHERVQLAASIDHSHSGALKAMDNGKMDRFSQLAGAIQGGKDMSDAQLYQSDIPSYWGFAQHYALDDQFFSTVSGPTFANHLFNRSLSLCIRTLVCSPREQSSKKAPRAPTYVATGIGSVL